jgi:hypothetical protein
MTRTQLNDDAATPESKQHRRFARAIADEVQAMAADVDKRAGRGMAPRGPLCADDLVKRTGREKRGQSGEKQGNHGDL